MSRRIVALAVAVLMAVSALFVLAPAMASASVRPAAGPSDVASASTPDAGITYTILNGYGGIATTFYPGEVGRGTLCFIVTDTLDPAVNVTLSDPNAAHDGLPTPAFRYVAVLNTATDTFNSYQAGVCYTFPATLAYGGAWTISFYGPNAGLVHTTVNVDVYFAHLSSSTGSGATLPGEHFSIFWQLLSEANESLYTRATSAVLSATYRGNGTLQNLIPAGQGALTPVALGEGQWNGTVPANATPDSLIQFEFYGATEVGGTVVENETAAVSVEVGSLVINAVGIAATPPTCTLTNGLYFVTGSLLSVCALIGADYLGALTPTSGIPVTVGYWNGTSHVAPTGAPTSLTTNASGEAAFTFLASSPPFIAETHYPGYDAINISVTLAGASTHYQWTAWWNATWTLYGYSPASGVIQVSLDRASYYAGAVATASWSVSASNETQTGPVRADGWMLTGANGIIYQQGVLNGSLSSGKVTFPITPAMVASEIYLWVYATNATETFDGEAYAAVLSPTLLLTATTGYYSAGSTTSVLAVLNGASPATNITYQVEGYWGTAEAPVASGTVANGSSISIAVPATNPPAAMTVDAWATLDGQVLTATSVNVLLARGYSILLGVTTASSYSDGSYQPGQTVTLSYQVVATGGASLPQVMTFELVALGYPYFAVLSNVGPSGTVPFTVPSNAVQGTLLIEMTARGTLTTGTCLPDGICSGVLTLFINPSPSVFNLELGAGSGVTVGWLILLILVIVVAVVLVLLLRRRGGRRATSASAPSTTSSMNPPAEAPTTPPPAEWQSPPPPTTEPTSTDIPPLPNPPKGPE